MRLTLLEDLFTRVGIALLLVGLFALSGGCMGINKAMTSMVDQVDWQSIVAEANAEGINPGLEVEAGLKYFMRVGTDGVSIRGKAAAKGDGNSLDGLSPGARAILIGPPIEEGPQ